ncbi:DNA cytosine methyltransferase [Methylotenera versatilis]|uniref:DNA cytosine methyltransferase n=1 Tax=Methylotenera versatilis TaxID=1055487 RepID=UPI000647D736|nr:DNA (cytosine-5-)-methyltransferase [Methylotenera versatilis]
MQKNNHIPIVDLFAGPGGLGEGFSSLDNGSAFKILISAEKETSAHQTLTLRAFFRKLKLKGGNALDCYYRFCNGESAFPYDESTLTEWEDAQLEARQIELGTAEGDKVLNDSIQAGQLGSEKPWVLIGGPPCQAYSIVGRSRNLGNAQYKAENDPRHFLYKEYLEIIQKYKPTVFVMENVKGILSSKVNGKKVFHEILSDLSNPDEALQQNPSGFKYKIYSLVVPAYYETGMDAATFKANDFVIKAEEFGIPQARHRVILLGVRDDLRKLPAQLEKAPTVKVSDVIKALPTLRSRLSKGGVDTALNWATIVNQHIEELSEEASSVAGLEELTKILRALELEDRSNFGFGGLRVDFNKRIYSRKKSNDLPMNHWYEDDRLNVWMNHETRGHMQSDLRRYLYASAFATAYQRSPKGHEEYTLSGLRPAHANWESGKFSDRFRVQLWDKYATTVTSHISKDGHYFIHPDPNQCRSLTVREAARLQTFPDNYFFQGNRTQQLHQVGNAVPPLLALKIAGIVKNLLS